MKSFVKLKDIIKNSKATTVQELETEIQKYRKAKVRQVGKLYVVETENFKLIIDYNKENKYWYVI